MIWVVFGLEFGVWGFVIINEVELLWVWVVSWVCVGISMKLIGCIFVVLNIY